MRQIDPYAILLLLSSGDRFVNELSKHAQFVSAISFIALCDVPRLWALPPIKLGFSRRWPLRNCRKYGSVATLPGSLVSTGALGDYY